MKFGAKESNSPSSTSFHKQETPSTLGVSFNESYWCFGFYPYFLLAFVRYTASVTALTDKPASARARPLFDPSPVLAVLLLEPSELNNESPSKLGPGSGVGLRPGSGAGGSGLGPGVGSGSSHWA